MLQKRMGEDADESADQVGTLAASEALRAGAAAGQPRPADHKDEDKMSLFWRVFGGTILSIVALVAVTLYNNLQGGINDLRAELTREREARTGLAKKEEVDARAKTQYDRIRVVEGYKADIEAMKERVATNTATVEATRKEFAASVEALKKDTAGMELLKERVLAVEAVKKEVGGIDVLRERFAGMAADLKVARDEIQRLSQEAEKNKTGDLERKAARDAQARQLDDTVRDIQKAIQDCREKLARFEGAQPAGPAVAPKGPRTVPVKADAGDAKGPGKGQPPTGAVKPVPVEDPDEDEAVSGSV